MKNGALVIGASVLSVALAHTADGGERLRLIERATNEHTVQRTPKADSLGDLIVFANPLYEADSTKSVGTSRGFCVRTEVGVGWQCTFSLELPKGSCIVEGHYPDSGEAQFAVVGGTGLYTGAHGTLRVHPRDSAHSTYDFDAELL